MAPGSDSLDIFDDILDLEGQYYQEGFALGTEDGARSGLIEGRIFGIEKGFEKFLEMGRLNGLAAVWKARLASALPPASPSQPGASASNTVPAGHQEPGMISFKTAEKIQRHLDRLQALVDPKDISTENTEDAVAEFDERLRDASAKSVLITKLIGDKAARSKTSPVMRTGDPAESTPEDAETEIVIKTDDAFDRPDKTAGRRSLNVRRIDQRIAQPSRPGQQREMEDFVGLPGSGSAQ